MHKPDAHSSSTLVVYSYSYRVCLHPRDTASQRGGSLEGGGILGSQLREQLRRLGIRHIARPSVDLATATATTATGVGSSEAVAAATAPRHTTSSTAAVAIVATICMRVLIYSYSRCRCEDVLCRGHSHRATGAGSTGQHTSLRGAFEGPSRHRLAGYSCRVGVGVVAVSRSLLTRHSGEKWHVIRLYNNTSQRQSNHQN